MVAPRPRVRGAAARVQGGSAGARQLCEHLIEEVGAGASRARCVRAKLVDVVRMAPEHAARFESINGVPPFLEEGLKLDVEPEAMAAARLIARTLSLQCLGVALCKERQVGEPELPGGEACSRDVAAFSPARVVEALG